MDDLQRLEDWAAPLLERMSATERRGLARTIARDLRRENAANMRAQRGPDGAAWAPRKNKLRDERGRVRRKAQEQAMFVKLRSAKHLRTTATATEAAVGFLGRAERIARVHHEGLRDRVQPDGPQYQYLARPMLAITDQQAERVRALILDHLNRDL